MVTKKTSKKHVSKKEDTTSSHATKKEAVSSSYSLTHLKTPELASQVPSELDKVIEQIPDDQKDRLLHIKKSVDAFKEKIVARLEGYVMGISLLPPDKDDDKKEKINVLTLIDDKDVKKMTREELYEKVHKINEDIASEVDTHLHVQTVLLSDLWQQCYDAKYELLQLIAMGATIYDTGMMAAVKISEIHKDMVLKKFEKYIVSYVLAGSLTQGKATPESDIDVFIVIDDTDVKKMTRVELRDKLRSIIIQMGMEAGQMTGIQNKINIQVYILTDFWENIKDANPVIFTFLRDGVPFYDRGIFMPWKQLLQMGRIKPSPEAIEMFMGSGRQFMDRIDAKIKEIVMEDLFWALLTPSQAALMMYGIPPTTPKETPIAMEDILVKKEKILEPEFVKTLKDVLKIRKELEHGTKKHVTGKEMDDLVKRSSEYLQRLEKLFEDIQIRKEEEQVLHMYENILTITRDVLRLEGLEKVEDKHIEKEFEDKIIKKGYLPEKYNRVMSEIFKAKKDYDAEKLSKQEVSSVSKSARELTTVLIEHIQRKRGQELEKTKIRVKCGDHFGEVILLGDVAYIIQNIDDNDKKILRAKVTEAGTLIDKQEITLEELEDALMSVTIPPKVFVKHALFDDIKHIFGEDVEFLVNY